MFSVIKSSQYTNDTVLIQGACVALDTKPTSGIANGSMCIEIDTGKIYAFDEESGDWIEQPGAGGGGGSGFSTATVTVNSHNAYFNGEVSDGGYSTIVGLLVKGNLYVKDTNIGEPTELDILMIQTPCPCLSVYAEPSVTGDATVTQLYEDEWLISISGDCTITA